MLSGCCLSVGLQYVVLRVCRNKGSYPELNEVSSLRSPELTDNSMSVNGKVFVR